VGQLQHAIGDVFAGAPDHRAVGEAEIATGVEVVGPDKAGVPAEAEPETANLIIFGEFKDRAVILSALVPTRCQLEVEAIG
jgi:hypothetical protein